MVDNKTNINWARRIYVKLAKSVQKWTFYKVSIFHILIKLNLNPSKFDGNKTIDIANQKFKFSVKKGESVWMNIDPITLGQHIRITDLRCTIEYD